MGGLIEKGAYSKFWLREEEHIRDGGLIERGLNRALTVVMTELSILTKIDELITKFNESKLFHHFNSWRIYPWVNWALTWMPPKILEFRGLPAKFEKKDELCHAELPLVNEVSPC